MLLISNSPRQSTNCGSTRRSYFKVELSKCEGYVNVLGDGKVVLASQSVNI